MRKILAVTLLFMLISLSACAKKSMPQTTQDQILNSGSELDSFCSLNSTWASACDTDTWKLFSITSTAFENGNQIPIKYSCMWENINPPLEILNTPKWTQSFAMIVHDPDAPGWDWIHWIILDLSPNLTKIEEWYISSWISVGLNSRWKSEYRWPCPPSGTHRYFFKIYAIDTDWKGIKSSFYTDFPDKISLSQFEEITKWHILWTAEIMWTYGQLQ